MVSPSEGFFFDNLLIFGIVDNRVSLYYCKVSNGLYIENNVISEDGRILPFYMKVRGACT